MLNVKDEIYQALQTVTENVTDYYPRDWEKDLAIQYMEEDNRVVEYTDMEEQKAYCRYRIDIFPGKVLQLLQLLWMRQYLLLD